MTMYVKTQEDQVQIFPYDTGSFLRDNPNTSFPRPVPDSVFADYGVYPVASTDRPEYDQTTHNAKQLNPVLVDGVWLQQWSVELREDADVQARSKRDRLLAQSDWTQVVDAPVDQAAWATYRQALRDVPAQAGFPENIDWPDVP